MGSGHNRETKVAIGYSTNIPSAKQVVKDAEKIGKEIANVSSGGLSDKKTQVLNRAGANYDQELDRIAQNQRKRIIEESKLLGLSAIALEKRSKELEVEYRANLKAIQVLEASGDTSEANAKKVQKYDDANKELAQTLSFITDKALPKAIANNKAGALSANEYYDEVNRGVSLAGDATSNLMQVGGALDALGVSGASTALQLTAAGTDLLEGLPRLKAAAGGIGGAIGTLVSSIGLTGLGLGAVALGAVVAISKLSEELDKARKAGEEYAKTLADIAQTNADAQVLLSQGDTEGVLQRLKDVQDERLNNIIKEIALNESLAEAEADLAYRKELLSQSAGFLTDAIGKLDPEVVRAQAVVDELKKEITGLGDTTVTTALQQKELNQQLLDYGLTQTEIEAGIAELSASATDATEAVTALNTALLAQADSTRNRYLEEISLLDQTDEALKDRQKALADEMIANQRAIDVLKASGDTSKEVTAQIEKYAQANAELGKTLDFISNTALPNATARAQAEATRADAEQTQKDIITATKKYNDTLETITADGDKAMLDIEKKRTDTLLDITKKYADDTANALTKVSEDLANNKKRFDEDDLKARQTALNAELDATRDHYRSLSDISTNAKRDEQDALRNLDFKGAFDARRNANRAIADEQKKFAEGASDRAVNQERERKERIAGYLQAQSDAREAYQKELQLAKQNQDKALAEARTSYQKEQAEARNAQATKLRDLQTSYAQEIALARQTSAQRLAIEAQTNARLLAQAQSLLASLSSFRPSGSGFRPTPTAPNRPNPSQPPNTGNRGGGGNRSQTIIINGAGNPRRVADQIQNLSGRGNNGGARR